MNSDIPSKSEQFQAFLDRGGAFVHLDPRRPGVELPASVSSRPRIVLQVRRALTIPLPEIAVDDEALRVTLTFGGEPFRCTLPWSAVFTLVAPDGEVTVWPMELPQELAPDRTPIVVDPSQRSRSVHPGRPVSLPPPSMGRARASKNASRAPVEKPATNSPSVVPGSLAAALRIPRAPALPRSLDVPAVDEPRPRDSTPAASRAMRVNDSLSHFPQNERGDE